MVSVYPFRDDMIMLVHMRDRVAVRASVVGVYEGMLMNMRMISDHGIDHDEHGPRKHDSQRKQIHSGQLLMQDEKRQKGADKRSDRVVSAGFRRAENTLRPDVQENTQPVQAFSAVLRVFAFPDLFLSAVFLFYNYITAPGLSEVRDDESKPRVKRVVCEGPRRA